MIDTDYEDEFHSPLTISLGELAEGGWFDLSHPDRDYPKYTHEHHQRLCDKMLNYHYDRDIGILPPLAWYRRSAGRRNELLPMFLPLYCKLDTRPDILNATDEYYKSRNVFSDFPQTQLSGNQDYATTGTDHQYERVHDGTIIDLAERLRQYDDVDLMVVNELEPLFSCLFTVNINAW